MLEHPTKSQIGYIVYIWSNSDRNSFKNAWNKIPKHNKKYPEYQHNKQEELIKVDSQKAIIEDWLKDRLRSYEDADYMIRILEGKVKHSGFKFRRLLLKLNMKV